MSTCSNSGCSLFHANPYLDVSHLFSVNLLFVRVKSCSHLVKDMDVDLSDSSFVAKLGFAVLSAARYYCSGKRHVLFIFDSSSQDLKEQVTHSQRVTAREPFLYLSRGEWFIWLTSLRLFSCAFEQPDDPIRIWTHSEINGNFPFFTRMTWSLENGFCRSRTQSFIMMVAGNSAMTQTQLRSSSICYFVGICFYFLLMLAILIWIEAPPAFIAVVAVLFICMWARYMR